MLTEGPDGFVCIRGSLEQECLGIPASDEGVGICSLRLSSYTMDTETSH